MVVNWISAPTSSHVKILLSCPRTIEQRHRIPHDYFYDHVALIDETTGKYDPPMLDQGSAGAKTSCARETRLDLHWYLFVIRPADFCVGDLPLSWGSGVWRKETH